MRKMERESGLVLFGETSNREFVIDCSCLARAREISSILSGGWILLGLVELDGNESRKCGFLEGKNTRLEVLLILV